MISARKKGLCSLRLSSSQCKVPRDSEGFLFER
jgi:hypothetical protein